MGEATEERTDIQEPARTPMEGLRTEDGTTCKPERGTRRAQWMRAISILHELLVGFGLLFVPWSRIWQDNWLFWTLGWPRSWLMTGPVKGAISGLGAAFLVSAASRILRVPLVDESDPRSF